MGCWDTYCLLCKASCTTQVGGKHVGKFWEPSRALLKSSHKWSNIGSIGTYGEIMDLPVDRYKNNAWTNDDNGIPFVWVDSTADFEGINFNDAAQCDDNAFPFHGYCARLITEMLLQHGLTPRELFNALRNRNIEIAFPPEQHNVDGLHLLAPKGEWQSVLKKFEFAVPDPVVMSRSQEQMFEVCKHQFYAIAPPIPGYLPPPRGDIWKKYQETVSDRKGGQSDKNMAAYLAARSCRAAVLMKDKPFKAGRKSYGTIPAPITQLLLKDYLDDASAACLLQTNRSWLSLSQSFWRTRANAYLKHPYFPASSKAWLQNMIDSKDNSEFSWRRVYHGVEWRSFRRIYALAEWAVREVTLITLNAGGRVHGKVRVPSYQLSVSDLMEAVVEVSRLQEGQEKATREQLRAWFVSTRLTKSQQEKINLWIAKGKELYEREEAYWQVAMDEEGEEPEDDDED